jgi:CRISPR-associated protein Cmr1
MMIKQTYTVRFVTPAFLGDAEQNGAWRTPPFKALLRQWWRVATAKENVEELRKAEGELFGNAADNDFCKSKVRLRLESWSKGELNQLPAVPELVCHNEVDLSNLPAHVRQRYYCSEHDAYHKVAASFYLGFGPVGTQGIRKAITPESDKKAVDQENCLLLAVPNEQNECFESIIQLVHWFGAIGGRSRNGWGSLLLKGSKLKELEALNQSDLLLKELAKPLKECLNLNWPHAFGKDDKGLLIWTSRQTTNTWRDTMVELAKTKIAFRTALRFDPNRHHRIDQRHILAYPVTHHNFNPWGNQRRLANQLRLKVTKIDQGYIGVAYHLPCAIPKELQDALNPQDRNWINQQQLSIWQTVHQSLDATMQRI